MFKWLSTFLRYRRRLHAPWSSIIAITTVMARKLRFCKELSHSISPLRLSPGKKHEDEQDDAGQRYTLCQLEGESIKVVILQVGLARNKQEEAGNSSICHGK